MRMVVIEVLVAIHLNSIKSAEYALRSEHETEFHFILFN